MELPNPKDPARFRQEDVEAIWSGYPRCLITALQGGVDLHHCLGRGGKYDREVFSSIFNCVPLIRSVHHGPARDHPDMRRFFLNRVRTEVFQAVGQERYELRPYDLEFLKVADEFLAAS